MLVYILLIAIAFIVFATSKLKLHPFIALLIAAYGIAVSVGMGYTQIATTITKGFGNILAYIGIVIVLGTIIGVILEKSGAAIKMADVILKIVGKKRPVLAMSIIGYIVSIPVFCDSGFVILNALKRSLVRQLKVSGVAMSVALATGLFATHTLVPPTPGPIAAAGNLMVDNLGLVIIFGILISIITMLAGYFWAIYSGKIYTNGEDSLVDLEKDSEVIEKYGELPSAFKAFAPIFIPILLIATASIVKLLFTNMNDNILYKLFVFLGNPSNALFIGLLFAMTLLPKFDEERLSGWIGEGIKNAGEILIITGAGGALGLVLKESGIGAYLGDSLKTLSLGIFVPFIISAALKSAQGSSTTALVVTSSTILPLLASLGLDSEMGKVLTVMAIGAGAMTVSHANDSFFWVVSRFSQMDVATAYKSFTMATLIQGLVTILIVYILAAILL
ncbi:gluconate transporter [Malaciobacter molluscorum LMG 25693]|uniref:Gluconate transporter n=1 Tax=Malaciobacter molluscorum LMG 25693 TaxID=870501 RepID=A0A2G1DHU3_9BACT|nr:GntP family permease [Malaciobacter molluscorum]AXX93015.1 putative proton:gluconate symporter [Malaciobacter molluscorum LMG 25693]PHO18072.1 gluconate transporter [Malaciobacter molluscorum LMG 25693]